MKAIVLLAHATADVHPLYAAALGPDVIVLPFVAPPPGMSSAYERLAATLRGGKPGGFLPALLRYLGAPMAPGVPIVVASWSGGYALLRELAKSEEDINAISAWVLLDGGHTSLEADHTALDAGVMWAVNLAKRAAEGRCVFAMAHTDVVTPQSGPDAYASTTQFAAELVRLAGQPRGGFILEAFNGHPPNEDREEHVDALRKWGGAFVKRALDALESTADTMRGADIPRQAKRTLGETALDVALAELAAGVAEVPPGSNDGPRMRLYRAGCVRGGKALSLGATPWCAEFVGLCDSVARGEIRLLGDDEEPPILWRASVSEIVRDAIKSGAWRPRGGDFVPLPGDLVILKRGGQDPTLGGDGHVARVEMSPGVDGAFTTIGGNEGDRVARTTRHMNDDEIVGFVAYPRRSVVDAMSTADLARGAAAAGLDRAAREALNT